MYTIPAGTNLFGEADSTVTVGEADFMATVGEVDFMATVGALVSVVVLSGTMGILMDMVDMDIMEVFTVRHFIIITIEDTEIFHVTEDTEMDTHTTQEVEQDMRTNPEITEHTIVGRETMHITVDPEAVLTIIEIVFLPATIAEPDPLTIPIETDLLIAVIIRDHQVHLTEVAQETTEAVLDLIITGPILEAATQVHEAEVALVVVPEEVVAQAEAVDPDQVAEAADLLLVAAAEEEEGNIQFLFNSI